MQQREYQLTYTMIDLKRFYSYAIANSLLYVIIQIIGYQ